MKLSIEQVRDKADYIRYYSQPDLNASSASKVDANANVDKKNVATLNAELYKAENVQLSRYMIQEKIKALFDKDLADEFERQVLSHEIYVHDESHPILPYCVAITLQPFLSSGMLYIGGESKAPMHLESFCGSFVNLIFAVSCQFAGAVTTVEFLTCFDYFARKDYGPDYLRTETTRIKNHLQHVIYALNQPAAARGYQSTFWNISVFDKAYADRVLNSLTFEDGSHYEWESLDRLQRFFLTWFNEERTKALLTFPVVTMALKTRDGDVEDRGYRDVVAKEFSQGNSFFVYMSDSVDSLSSCCRLRNQIDEKVFSYTLGGTGVSVGSLKVITINFNRLIQTGIDLKEQVVKIHKYLFAFRSLIMEMLESKMLPVYDAGYIHISRQYLTIGINGMVEAAEYLGMKIDYNPEYVTWIQNQLKIIYEENKKARKQYDCMFNTEFVPAENLGVKNSQWDKKAGLKVSRDVYNSYFYIVEDDGMNILDKFKLHGQEILQYLDGGSALHLNLSEHLSVGTWEKLLQVAAKTGCNYFTYNVRSTICNSCGVIDKRDLVSCPKCGSEDVDHATRVIGYLKRESSFSEARQKEADLRYYENTAKSSVGERGDENDE
jgi:anaerobic ribonucleoside-triphosphate reductase